MASVTIPQEQLEQLQLRIERINASYEAAAALIQQQQAQIAQLTQAQQSTGGIQKPKVPRPPEFNGRQPSPVNWCYSMETFLAATGGAGYLGIRDAVQTAAAYLRGNALNWWRQHLHAVRSGVAVDFNTWEEFKTALIRQFTPVPPEVSARETLDRLKQTGSVYNYAQEYTSCMLQLPNMDEGDRVHRFIKGLKTEVRLHVALQQPDTLNKAIELAVKADAMVWKDKRTTVPYLNRKDTPGPVPMELGAMQSSQQNGKGDKQRNDRKKKEVECYYCHKLGHVAAVCRKKARDAEKKAQSTN
jgi:hypothetical protein